MVQKKRKTSKGRRRQKKHLTVDISVRAGGKKIFTAKDAKESDVMDSLEVLMRKYGCECRCR